MGEEHGQLGHQPKMASMTWSADCNAAGKSSTKGTSRSSSCLASRYHSQIHTHAGQRLVQRKKNMAEGRSFWPIMRQQVHAKLCAGVVIR